MKKLLGLLLLAISLPAFADEAKFTFLLSGDQIGMASLSIVRLADGGSKFAVDLSVEVNGQKIKQRQEERYDKNARPVSGTQHVEQSGTSVDMAMAYGASAVTVRTTVNGQKTLKTIKYPAGKSIKKPSQIWFFVTTPKPGTVSKEMDLDHKTMKWALHERKYVGPTTIELGGKEIKAFEVVDKNLDDGSTVTQWVDAKGMPYKVDFAEEGRQMSMERVGS